MVQSAHRAARPLGAAENRVDFLFGLARNSRLEKIIGKQMHEAKLEHAATSQAATASAGRWKTA